MLSYPTRFSACGINVSFFRNRLDSNLLAASLLLYYITDRTQFPGDEAERQRRLLQKIAEAVRAGVDYIQLREKDLSTRDLEILAQSVAGVIRESGGATRLLINSRTDVAIACQADGVHLRSVDLAPSEVREIWRHAMPDPPVISVSCHSVAEVARANADGANFALFAPVFEKRDDPYRHPAGLVALREACQQGIPVLALGGVTLDNARSCLDAGAAGIAAIRLFQENDITQVVRRLRD
jgi:thiamine-phosphate pyrophosphorylase